MLQNRPLNQEAFLLLLILMELSRVPGFLLFSYKESKNLKISHREKAGTIFSSN